MRSIIRDAVMEERLPLVLVVEAIPSVVATMEDRARKQGLIFLSTDTDSIRIMVATRTDKNKVRQIFEDLRVDTAVVCLFPAFYLEDVTPGDADSNRKLVLDRLHASQFPNLLMTMQVFPDRASLIISRWQMEGQLKPTTLQGVVRFRRRGEFEAVNAVGPFVLLTLGDHVSMADEIKSKPWRTYRFVMF